MWKKVGLGALAAIVVLLIAISTRPSTYEVKRSITIGASPEVVYAHVADFRNWGPWLPWAKLDPNMKTSYEGTQGTVGAKYAWIGNNQVGEGRMTVVSLDPNRRIDIKLEFIKPFESTAANGFTLEPAGKETQITWYMNGDNNFMGKAMSLFMNMDTMIGKDFEKGLADMKKVVESAPMQPAVAK